MEGETGLFDIKIAKDVDDYPWFWRFRSKGEIKVDISGQECRDYHAKRGLLQEIMNYIDKVEEDYEGLISEYLTSMQHAFSRLDHVDHTVQIEIPSVKDRIEIEMNLGNIHYIRERGNNSVKPGATVFRKINNILVFKWR